MNREESPEEASPRLVHAGGALLCSGLNGAGFLEGVDSLSGKPDAFSDFDIRDGLGCHQRR